MHKSHSNVCGKLFQISFIFPYLVEQILGVLVNSTNSIIQTITVQSDGASSLAIICILCTRHITWPLCPVKTSPTTNYSGEQHGNCPNTGPAAQFRFQFNYLWQHNDCRSSQSELLLSSHCCSWYHLATISRQTKYFSLLVAKRFC